MKTNNVIRSYVLKGILIGMLFPILGIVMSCFVFSPVGFKPSLVALHKAFPLLWIIDSAPIILGLISYQVGSKVQRSDRQFNIEIERSNETLLTKNTELEKLLLEKEVLLKEVHHRVKNNLQIVNGLLNLQASFLDDKKVQRVFQYSQQRISSMSMIHEMLYHSNDLSIIDFEEFSKNLIAELIKTSKLPDITISTKIEVSCKLNIDTAIPLGILINEIVTNSIKHGFVGKKTGAINLQIKKITDARYTLIINDTGVGFEGGLNGEEPSTLGLLLIDQLVIQINGMITKNQTDIGTQYTLNFQEITQKE